MVKVRIDVIYLVVLSFKFIILFGVFYSDF